MSTITENEIELICIDYMKDLEYKYVHGPDISPDGENKEREYDEVVLLNRLSSAIDRLNPSIPDEGKQEALKKITRVASPDLLINNETFHRMLTEGVDVEIRKDG